MSFIDSLQFMIGQAPAQRGGGMAAKDILVMAGFMIAIFYVMMIRPQQRREREKQAMINNVKAGTKVLFGGGLIGTIDKVRESTFIIKTGEVKVEVLRAAVSKVIADDEKLTGKELTQ